MVISFGKSLLASALVFVLGFGSIANAQEDLQSLFKEGVRLMRLGRDQEALEKFKAILRADPSNDQVYNLWRKAEEDVWARMLLKKGEWEKVAKALVQKATIGRKKRMMDPEAIKALVKQCLSESFPERRKASIILAREHGEYAVPYLLKALGDADNEDGQIFAEQALVELGPEVTLPLLESLKSKHALLRRNRIIVLRRIRDTRALPEILHLSKSDPDKLVREIARDAFAKLGGNPGRKPEDLLVERARRFRLEDPNYIGTFEQGDVIWEWKNDSLTFRKIPSLVFSVEAARQSAYKALDINPDFGPARVELVLDYLTEKTAVSQQIEGGDTNPELVSLNNQLLNSDVVIASAGLDAVRQAAVIAMNQGDAPLCRNAFRALANLETIELQNT